MKVKCFPEADTFYTKQSIYFVHTTTCLTSSCLENRNSNVLVCVTQGRSSKLGCSIQKRFKCLVRLIYLVHGVCNRDKKNIT